MRFNFHHGQVKVATSVDGKPVKMSYLPSSFKKRVEVGDYDAGVGRVAVHIDPDTGDGEVEKPMAIAQMYILGWPLNVSVDGKIASEPVVAPADVIALRELKRLSPFFQEAIAISLKTNREDPKERLTVTARRIADPWSMFGINPEFCRRVNFENPPEGLVFPRPDKAFITDDLESDPFWELIDADVVADLKSKTDPWNRTGLRNRSM